jgi:uncharacterized protein with FMN-binding domain
MAQESRTPLLPPQCGRPETPPGSSTQARAKKQPAKGKKVTNGLVALGTAAIISVYGVGYVRTSSAAADVAEMPTIAIATMALAETSTGASPVASLQSPRLAPTATVGTTAGSQIATTTAPAATVSATATTAPATVATPSATATTAAAKSQYTDGTYTGTGTSRHGSITATVVIQGGKIVSANITQCGTRYPCSKIAALPGEAVSRQSATVDMVSGATDSAEAYQGAVKNALAQAAA